MSKITTRMKRHVRHVLKDEKPTIWIGKEGYTPQLSVEIENQLSKRGASCSGYLSELRSQNADFVKKEKGGNKT